MQIEDSGNRINADRIGTHSIRIGGPNATFAHRYDTDVIRRRGAVPFMGYLWNDMALPPAGSGVLKATGLLRQLQRQSTGDTRKESGITSGRSGGDVIGPKEELTTDYF